MGLSVNDLPCGLVLIGLRGSGKSTVGRALALRCHSVFVDLDELVIAEFAEDSVREIWDRHGEEAWREAESRLALATFTDLRGDMVLALGGGTAMMTEVREGLRELKRSGGAVVVYLRGEPEILLERLKEKEGDRPRLTGEDDLLQEIQAVYGERDSVYSEVADLVIGLQEEEVDETVGRIVDELVENYFEGEKEG